MLLAGCLLSAPAFANTGIDETWPEPIRHLALQGLQVQDSFPVGDSLIGWIVRAGQQEQLLYTTQDGEFLINGVVLDAQGQDLTRQHQRDYLAQPDWSALASSHKITEPSLLTNEAGETISQRELYLFFDPLCPFSRLAWLALQPYREQGLTLHWIPIAYLQPDSRLQAAALLASADQAADQLHQLMREPSTQLELDAAGIQAQAAALQDNMGLMRAFGLSGTPSWIWQDEQGQLNTHTGMLRLPRISELLDLPQPSVLEPELIRYR
ncbi:thiol:disulfide interchange protein DsbG [Marinospirillum sp. MEB164]|uniref:Thiol:disulfide interchange protein DsbG n=1 Tax=Marinospirillum alkalitolerans TaxID=3123374 RepID=A0ABW8PV87_9GAMM